MLTAAKLTSEINELLRVHGATPTIQQIDLIVTENVVTDASDEPLSKAIAEHIWPSITTDEVFHFTSAEAAEAIEKTRLFRLYNLERRHREHEIEAFCKAHNLNGYLALDDKGIPLYRREIMPQMFFASFASRFIDQDSQRSLWSAFGHDGARLRFRVSARNPDFRRIYYPGGEPQIPLLRDLIALIEGTYKRRFVLRGISRLCAFYLPSQYGIEDETRILFKKWDGFGPDVQFDGNWNYVDIPLGADSSTGFSLDLLEIQSDVDLDLINKKLLTPRS